MADTGDIVVCRFEGTGKLWPEGLHVRAGRVIKPSGPGGGVMVMLFRPVRQRPHGAQPNTWVSSSIVELSPDDVEVVR